MRLLITHKWYTSNNQRLRSAGDNDWSKRFCSSVVLCMTITCQVVKTSVIRLRGVDRSSKHAWSACVLWIPFILSGSPNECWLHTCDACVITTWRLGLRAPLVARNKIITCHWFVVFADCTEFYNAGFKASGVYVIKPPRTTPNGSFPVFCDQTTPPGGWIVIQKRFDGSERFSDRTWAEYQNGFGNLTGEFWLGLDKIYLLTRNPMKLRIDLGAPNGSNIFAVYKGFTIAGADQKYKLTSGRFTGK